MGDRDLNIPGIISTEASMSRGEIRQLSDHIAAQATAYDVLSEAYEKYAQALASIIVMIRHVNDDVSDLDEKTTDRLTETLQLLAVVGEQLRTQFDGTQKEHQRVLAGIAALTEYSVRISDSNRDVRLAINELYTEVQNVSEMLASIDTKVVGVDQKVDLLNKQMAVAQAERTARYQKWQIVAGVVVSIVTLLEALMMFHVIDWIVFPK